MTETKTPQPGEWWQRTVPVRGVINARFFIVGPSYDGKLIGMRQWLPMEEKDESDFRYGILDGTESIEHLPDCTGWDWEPEKWPKYYETKARQFIAYVRRDSETQYTMIKFDGSVDHKGIWSYSDNAREQLTEAEALSRVNPAPVESPDDWVEISDPDHWLRPGIDQIYRVQQDYGLPCGWESARVGCKFGEFSTAVFSRLRCRRKDIPTTKRLPVRLWVHGDSRNDERYNVFAKISPPAQHELYREIKFDGTQFYIEESG